MSPPVPSRVPHASVMVLILLCLPSSSAARTFGDPVNRCEMSQVASGPADALLDVTGIERAVFDGDPATAIALPVPDVLQFTFIGAPRWVNRIIVATDAPVFAIEVLTTDRVWTPYVTGSGVGRSDDQQILDAPGVYVEGVRFVSVGSAGDARTVRLAHMEARFLSIDPDDARLGTGDEGTRELHYDYCNDYAGTRNDLSDCDNDAHGLRDALPGDWTWYGHGNSDAWEEHFKSSGSGGTNNSHVDVADLSYYAGHGGDGYNDPATGTDLGSIIVGNTTHDDDNLVPSEIGSAWGDTDMEWFGASTCKTLRDAGQDYWAGGMAGIHLICGSEDNISDANYGDSWGDRMVDNGIFDSAQKVKDAWFDTIDDHNGGHDIAVVLGENSTMGNDYVHGQGSVASDPTVDATYTIWEYDVGFFGPAAPEVAVAFPRDAVRIPSPEGAGPQVFVTPEAMAQSRLAATSLPLFNVVPITVNSAYVAAIAQDICTTESHLCTGGIGPGNPGDLNQIDGLYELRVCTATGGYTYEDAGNWLAWRTAPPSLLTGDAAIQRAEQLLQTWGRRPADAAVTGVRYLHQRAVMRNGLGTELPESSFAIASQVRYQRRIGPSPGYNVVGPGGWMSLSFGSGGMLQRVRMGAWRTLTQGSMVTIAPFESVATALAMWGGPATIEGISSVPASIVINSWELGYYEPDCHAMVNVIRPVYILHCTLFGPNGPGQPADLYVWADFLPPVASIIGPQEDQLVQVGSTVCFSGMATRGVPPYTFTWRLDGMVIGTAATFCGTASLPMTGEMDQMDSTQTVQLIVTDAKGSMGYAHVRLVLTTQTGVDDRGGLPAPALLLAQNAPNPVRSGDAMQFTLTIPSRTGDDARVPVLLRVFDQAGRLVATPVDGVRPAGVSTLSWVPRDTQGRDLAPGVYAYRLEAGGQSLTRKLVVMP